MTQFDYKYQNPLGFACRMLIRAIVITIKAGWHTLTPTRCGQHITYAHNHFTRSISSHGQLSKQLSMAANRPFPSCCLPLVQNESWCSTIQMLMSLICMKIRNSFPFEWLCTRTRFETEAKSNSGTDYWPGEMVVRMRDVLDTKVGVSVCHLALLLLFLAHWEYRI